MLGDKVAAKRLAEQAGVPVVPWSGGPVEDAGQAAEAAARLGYPVVVKAVAGGGGRGIRLAEDPADIATAFESARSEAELAFGDPTLFVERLVAAARHVEVQVIADGHGTVWALGVRDCSIQRRHQKVIEESASTALNPATEKEIRKAAITLATAAGYTSAGTVEFLVSSDGADFLFMEVNTRLQVEHPVTEMTTGADLVKLQLHVAAGGRLRGSPPRVRGHAIEARLCAEDPGRGFEPAPGRIALLALPTGAGIRVDTGVREGDEVSPSFDSMIAKIIAWGHDRGEALARLRRALAQTTVAVAGGTTNRSFLRSVLDQPEVRDGTADNHWLDQLTAGGTQLPAADPVALLQAAVEAYDVDQAAEQAAFHARAARGSPGPAADIGHSCQLRYRGASYRLKVYRTGPSDLWRLANFRLRRLPSAADVHVFHGVAHDNPDDQRLFALAEVRDLVPARHAFGTVSYPRLELMGLSAISAMRQALAAIPGNDGRPPTGSCSMCSRRGPCPRKSGPTSPTRSGPWPLPLAWRRWSCGCTSPGRAANCASPYCTSTESAGMAW